MVGENLNTYDESEQISARQREETFLQTLKTVQLQLIVLIIGTKSRRKKSKYD